METRLYTTASLLGILLLFITIQLFSAHTQTMASENPIVESVDKQNQIGMLIFISPQYKEDIEIINSINTYVHAVEKDVGWLTEIVPINPDNNDYLKIDEIIEQYYNQHPIKACIMVGEDIHTALAGDCDYMEKPSIIPWSTIGGKTAYNTSSNGIICKPYINKICISLLYPTHYLNYATKKSQIISAFNKFSEKRQNFPLKNILVIESSDINVNSKDIYQNIDIQTKYSYYEDPTDVETISLIDKPYSILLVHGHSNPSGTIINSIDNEWFSADNIDYLDTPFFGADGCYVNGWWSQHLNNDELDYSINSTWYGSKIFTAENIRVMALGLLSQNGYSFPVSFIGNSIPCILKGKTIAESIINEKSHGDTIIIGDPTFHFTV